MQEHEIREIEPTAYVHSEESEDAGVIEILPPAESVPDIAFLTEYLLSHEWDISKRSKLFTYIEGLNHDQLLALWESFKGTYGKSINDIQLSDILSSHLTNVEKSKSLELRNASIEREVRRFGSFYDQLSRTFGVALSDTPLGEFRVDNLTAYIKKLNHDITTLNSAILEMSEMLLIGVSPEGADPDTPEMAINVERAVKICAIVGYSAKAWGTVYNHAIDEKKKTDDSIKALKDQLKSLNEAHTALQDSVATQQRKNAELAIRASSYMICNNSGFYLAVSEESARFSPLTLMITTDKEKALKLNDLELTRKIYDAMRDWAEWHGMVRTAFSSMHIRPETLFIAAESFTKVEA